MLTVERLPVLGPCMAFRPPGHADHVLDVIGLEGQRLRPADVPLWRGLARVRAAAFSGWGRDVVAPATATVVSVHDGEPDRRTVSLLRDVPSVVVIRPLRARGNLGAMVGNHVVLDVAGGFMLLAHLRHGSVQAVPGEQVSAGDRLGELGNSGNSVLPHVHVQAMTSPDPFTAAALPWQVRTLDRHLAGGSAPAPGPVPLRTPVRSQ